MSTRASEREFLVVTRFFLKQPLLRIALVGSSSLVSAALEQSSAFPTIVEVTRGSSFPEP